MIKLLLKTLLVLLIQYSSFSQVADHLVIAELYGGGGEQGSYWTNDYVIIYNPTTNSVSLSTWSVQYAKFNGSDWEVTNLNGSIAAGEYYSIQEGGGVWGILPLPFIPNAQGNIDIDKNKGKLALVSNQIPLTGSNPIDNPYVIDFIGYGNGTNAFEGSGPAPQLGLSSSLRRKDNNGNNTYGTNGNGWDTNDNSADFYVESDLIGNPPLPVELSSITAKVLRNGGVKLDWRTETEVNNFGFEIERCQMSKVNGPTEWAKIGFVEGHGNSNSPKEYSFEDKNVQYGSYAYRLKQVDTDGSFEYSNVIEVDAGNIPDGFVLEQNYPNPFNPSTKIKFAFAETQQAELKVFDLLGNEVATLFNGIADGGKIYESVFNAENYSSGIYIYRLATKSKVENRKMLLLK